MEKNKKLFRFCLLFLLLFTLCTSIGGIGCAGDGEETCVWDSSQWNNCNWQ